MVDVDRLAYSLGRGLRRGVDKLNSVVDENSGKVADFAGKVASGMEDAAKESKSSMRQIPATAPAAGKPGYVQAVSDWIASTPDEERGEGRGVAVDLAVRLPNGGNRVTRPTMVSQSDRSAVAVMAEIMSGKLAGLAHGAEVHQLAVSPTAIAVFAVQTGSDGFMEMVPLAVVHATKVPAGTGSTQFVPYNPYDREWPWESGDVDHWKYMSEDLVTVLGE